MTWMTWRKTIGVLALLAFVGVAAQACATEFLDLVPDAGTGALDLAHDLPRD